MSESALLKARREAHDLTHAAIIAAIRTHDLKVLNPAEAAAHDAIAALEAAAREEEQKRQESIGRCIRHDTIFDEQPCWGCVREFEAAARLAGKLEQAEKSLVESDYSTSTRMRDFLSGELERLRREAGK